jgi:hypothetical protein
MLAALDNHPACFNCTHNSAGAESKYLSNAGQSQPFRSCSPQQRFVDNQWVPFDLPVQNY